ncbi:MAG TPA: NTP transferase domain-containing protein [Verrucomicrobiae bacterium]
MSGRADVDHSVFGCRVLQDKFASAGPLAGIERALGATASPLLLVLAVDLPDMNAEFVRQLSTYRKQNAGAVPRIAGKLEPLAAFYPKMAQSLAAAFLFENSNGVKNFAEAANKTNWSRWLIFTNHADVYLRIATRQANFLLPQDNLLLY